MGVRVPLDGRAGGAIARQLPLPGVLLQLRARQLRGNDARGQGDDRVADQHADGGDGPADRRDGHDIAVADGGDGHDRPVDALGNIVKAVLWALDHVQQAAEDRRQHQHQCKEHENLASRAAQGRRQVIGLLQQREHAQHPENAQDPQQPDDQQRRGLGDKQRQIGRQDRQQVDHAVDARHIPTAVGHTPHAHGVLHRKGQRETPFHQEKQPRVLRVQRPDRVQHDDNDTGSYHQDQYQVEPFADGRFGPEDDVVEPLLQGGKFLH